MVVNVLTIAGSDSGGGAGIQADLKSFSAQGTYGASVITAITAQNTREVTAVHPIPNDVIRAQIDAVLSDIDVKAIKIGMLGQQDLIETVAVGIKDFSGPIVLDPVMISKSGAQLLPEDALAELRDTLLPRAALITPNLPEAAVLLGQKLAIHEDDVQSQGEHLRELGAGAVLMKGGHAEGVTCTDILLEATKNHRFQAPRIATQNTHGTGCSYSSAIAALLAKGHSMSDAVRRAHAWLHNAIVNADKLHVGAGHGPIHHFHEIWA